MTRRTWFQLFASSLAFKPSASPDASSPAWLPHVMDEILVDESCAGFTWLSRSKPVAAKLQWPGVSILLKPAWPLLFQQARLWCPVVVDLQVGPALNLSPPPGVHLERQWFSTLVAQACERYLCQQNPGMMRISAYDLIGKEV